MRPQLTARRVWRSLIVQSVNGVAFWDASEAVPHVTSIDGVHLSPADHAAFAQVIAPQIEALL